MGALVVYESVSGNTRDVATAIAAGLTFDTRINRPRRPPSGCAGLVRTWS